MSFVLKKTDELVPVRIKFDPSTPHLPPGEDADESALEEIVFYRRVFTGHDTRAFADAVEVTPRGGDTQAKYGTVLRKKIVRGYVKIEGMEDAKGRPVPRMTDDVFDLLFDWIVDLLVEGLKDEDLSKAELEGNS